MNKVKSDKLNKSFGFTIVELLVVIVVIGILAAIIIISYTGISQKAIVASVKSDLAISYRQLKSHEAINEIYPTTILCGPSSPNTVTNLCLKPSPGNEYTYSADNSSSPRTFSLKAKNGDIEYLVTNNSIISELAPLTAISSIQGTPMKGNLLTAGTLTPSGATATYQWQISSTANGTYNDIAGATNSTYTPVTSDISKFIKVKATGSNNYRSSVTSVNTIAVINSPPITASGGIVTDSGSYKVHTFNSAGTFIVTSAWGGELQITIDGGGGGGAGAYLPCDDGGDGGFTTVKISNITYKAYGGGGGISTGCYDDNGVNGTPGITDISGVAGFFGISGGANNGGWFGGDGQLGRGGHGGRITNNNLSVFSGQSISVLAIGAGGYGGAGCCGQDDYSGGDGSKGVVIFKYLK